MPSWAPYPAPEPPPRRSSWRRALPYVGVAVLVALLTAAITWSIATDDGDDDEASSTTTATTEAPPSTEQIEPPAGSTPPAAPAPSVDPAELAATVKDLQAFVESQRGMPFKSDVVVELLDDGEFQERLLADLDEAAEDIELQQKLLAALGLIDPGTDLMAVQKQLLGAGVLGFYDPETDELVVRGAALTPFVKQTIVHELVHAHDDQWFELHRPHYDEATDEVAFGLSATVEGNARRIENAWVDTLTREERAERTAEELSFGLQADLSGVPPFLIDLIMAPYQFGQPLVDHLSSRGGEEAINEVITTPPTTSEQVLLPPKLDAGEGAEAVDTPRAGGEVIDEGVFGMLMVQLMLADVIGDRSAADAADGWAGDRYVAWDTPDGVTCVRVHLRYDDVNEAMELLLAFEAYTREEPHVTAQLLDEVTVELNGCSESASSGGSPL